MDQFVFRLDVLIIVLLVLVLMPLIVLLVLNLTSYLQTSDVLTVLPIV